MKYMVSVYMLTYKHELFIEEAIRGVLKQKTNFEYELIISNDCSPDKTDTIINEIINSCQEGYRIKYFRHLKNIGMHNNAQFAIQKCKGKYVSICEGDDYWTDPHKLQKQFDFLESKPEYSLCFHPAKILMTNGKLVNEFEITIPNKFHQLIDMARFGNYIRTPTVMFRNILTEQDLNLLKKCPAGDFPLYLILGQYGNYGFIADTMAVYRQGVGIWSTLDNIQSVLGFTITIIHAKEYFFNKEDYTTADILNEKISFFISSIHNDLKMNDLEPYLNDKVVLKDLLTNLIDIKREDKTLSPLIGVKNLLNKIFNRNILTK